MHHLRFRQIHLDFHTSEIIPSIGDRFDKRHWQETLKKAAVNSVTTFATCHHGWAYYRTEIGKMHPNLKFDLLRSQYDASKEIDINVPIYLTAGVNNMAAISNPQWRQIGPEGKLTGWAHSNIAPGFFMMCFNTGYLNFLCDQISEVVHLFPECDGIFLDIISQPQCCCHVCIASMQEKGLDPLVEADRIQHSNDVLMEYYRRTTVAARSGKNSDMPIFHNSGHISVGDLEKLKYFSHLELESLPTGGWGYDHFPMSAKYCNSLPFDYLGMTGKFHTTWGEFGGFKHPNALQYECAAMLAVGAKCSVGDQLHPQGLLDESTYEIIGKAYNDVEAKEPWCDNVQSVSDIGVLSSAATRIGKQGERDNNADTGAARILLEGHLQFDILDTNAEFSKYKVLLLPDNVIIDAELKSAIDSFLSSGGKLILSSESALDTEGRLHWDIGAEHFGKSECVPDYILPSEELRPEGVSTPMVMYMSPERIKATSGKSIGDGYDSYFNRAYNHFCSHQHAPYKTKKSGYDCGVRTDNILYFAHPVFSIYRAYGAVSYKSYVLKAIKEFIGSEMILEDNMPSTARVHLNEQTGENRYVLHLLYANTVLRGGAMEMHGGTVRATNPIEVVDELMPLRNAKISLKLPKEINKATLEPQGKEVAISNIDGRQEIEVEEFSCHQMVVLNY